MNRSRGWQEAAVYLLVPVLIGILTLVSWLFSYRHSGSTIGYIGIGIALLAILLGGWQRFVSAFQDIAHYKVTVNVFVTTAILITMATGEFVPAAAVIFVMSVAGALESYTVDSTRRSIHQLLDLAPQMANVRLDSEEITKPVAELQPGEIIIVRPGDRIPVDGIVVAGTSAVNQAPITGESLPIEKSKGQEVFAGTLNESGLLEVLSTKIGTDTALAGIVHLVEEAQESRAPIQGIADRFTTWFFPTILTIAILGYLFSGDIRIAVSILLVACPCAFAVATPSAVAAGIANMARRSVLIKGGIFFEIAGKINSLVIDKTGTLTLGQPKVMEIFAAEGFLLNEVLLAAAIAEKYSEHPLAKAVMASAAQRGLDVPDPDEFRIEVANGVEVIKDGHRIVVGKDAFLRVKGVEIPSKISQVISNQFELGRTTILVAKDHEPIGFLAIADEVRPETAESIRALKALGLSRIAILTGDDARTARTVALETGVDEYHAGLLPQDKQTFVKRMKGEGRMVAMVGDGINDAPALALADVGIVMGGTGTDAAIEAADVTLQDGRLLRLVEFIQMSRKVLARIKINIFFSIIYNALGLTLALIGYLNPVTAVIFQEAGCISVILSSTLLLWAEVPGLKLQPGIEPHSNAQDRSD